MPRRVERAARVPRHRRSEKGACVSESNSVEWMWAAFIAAFPDVAGSGATYEAWHFCDNASDANELAELVLSGRKRATAGALWSYEDEGEPLPKVGDFAIVTDWANRARCVIRMSSVEVRHSTTVWRGPWSRETQVGASDRASRVPSVGQEARVPRLEGSTSGCVGLAASQPQAQRHRAGLSAARHGRL